MSKLLEGVIKRFGDNQVMGLTLVLLSAGGVILLFGEPLAPYFTAVVVAYLLEGVIRGLKALRIPRMIAMPLVYILFIVLVVVLVVGLMPHLMQQLTKLLGEMPRITRALENTLRDLSEYASDYANPEMIESLTLSMIEGSQELAASSVTYLLQGVPGLFSIFVYLILVPFLVFFFLKDKKELLDSLRRLLPRERRLVYRVLRDVNAGVGGYVRGKFWEMMVLGLSTYIVFTLMKFEYAFLLAILTGLSVLIPFVGVLVVTLPVAVLGIVQWGQTWEAAQPTIAYGILQLLDGIIVAPLILGETVKVHPTTIILAVLFFGYLWGILGVFFAVPLAVLVKSVFESLPDPTPVILENHQSLDSHPNDDTPAA